MTSRQPDISLIIRFSRPETVGQALESVLNQQWSDAHPPMIEVLIVDALGNNTPCAELTHRGLSAREGPNASACANVMLRWISQQRPLNRPQALIAGIESAQGEFMMFLDDDDTLESTHIDKLYQGFRQALQSHPRLVAATTGVRSIMRDASDDQAKSVYTWDAALKPERLILTNRIPFMGLIAKTGVMKSCQIDPGLEVYEDWDLMLQLIQRGEFIHLPGVTANYLANPNGSGASDKSRFGHQAARVREKWVSKFTEEDFEKLNQDLAKADTLEAVNAALQKDLHEVRQVLQATRKTLDTVTQSLSWRMTAPLRRLKSWLKR